MHVVLCKQSNRYYCARMMNWAYLTESKCTTVNYKASLQEQLVLSKFKSFPNVVNIHRVFVDDKSDPYDPEWKM